MERQLNKVSRGFFQLLAAGGESDTPEQICKELAEHVVKPFGANPTIRRMEVDGQSACLVWPSEDQGAPWDASVVIKYPQPVEIEGDRYSILELNADKDYILEIIRSLRLISSTRDNSPYLLTIAPQNTKEPQHATWKAGMPFSIVLTMQNRTSRAFHIALADPTLEHRCMSLPKHEPARVTTQHEKHGFSRKCGLKSPT